MDIKTEYEPDIGPTILEYSAQDMGPTEMLFETVEMPITAKTIVLWSNSETKLLMELYRSLINEVGPDKRLKHKKDMWLEISSHYPCRTAKQCEERFKTVLKRKKNNFGTVYITEAGKKAIDLNDDNDDGGDERNSLNIKRPKIVSNKEEFITNFKQITTWSPSDTRKLMELFKQLLPEVGSEKRFQHKKEMWIEISTHFLNKSPIQCEQRLKTILKRKRTNIMIKGKTKTNEVKKSSNSYYDIEVKTEDTINSSCDNDIKEQNSEHEFSIQTDNSSNSPEHITPNHQETELLNKKPKKVQTLHELLLDIANKREEGKERRHREKMAAINKMNNLLQQLIENKK